MTIPFPSAKMTHYGLRISEYRACRACTCALAPAADEYNLNVVDCNALSLSHAGLPSQSVGVCQWGVPPAAGGKRKMVFRGLPRACWDFFFSGSNSMPDREGGGSALHSKTATPRYMHGRGTRRSQVGRTVVIANREGETKIT